MRLRREWFGMSCLLTSSRPVAGEVLWVSSHCSMALRSYVWPSACFATERGDGWVGQTPQSSVGGDRRLSREES